MYRITLIIIGLFAGAIANAQSEVRIVCKGYQLNPLTRNHVVVDLNVLKALSPFQYSSTGQVLSRLGTIRLDLNSPDYIKLSQIWVRVESSALSPFQSTLEMTASYRETLPYESLSSQRTKVFSGNQNISGFIEATPANIPYAGTSVACRVCPSSAKSCVISPAIIDSLAVPPVLD